MSLINKPNTFTVGATIIASEHNANFDTIYNDYNGNITNDNIASGAGIVDTKLAQIVTPGKVAGDALTNLANIPVGAGDIPEANMSGNAVTLTGAQTVAGVKTFTSIPVLPASNPTADDEAARKAYVDASVEDYGTSTSVSTTRSWGGIIIAHGTVTLSSGTATITNIGPFTSTGSYVALVSRNKSSGVSQALVVAHTSTSSITITDTLGGSEVVNWFVFGT